MITLISGQPGHGKTLRAMELAVEAKAKGRAVYVHGVRGLDYAAAGFFPLDDPKQWQALPDRAFVVLDECYSVFPRRAPGANTPDYVKAMATHRHRGFDFVLICQQAKQQIDGFLLGLVEWHEHVRRKAGLKGAIILCWDKFAENTNNSQIKKPWKYPAQLMQRNLYESTVMDTTRVRVPWFVWALPLAVAGLGLLVWRVTGFFSPDEHKSAKVAAPVVSKAEPKHDEPRSVGQPFGAAASRPDDLVSFFKPRIEGQPWTAPAYDGRAVVAEPEVYCIAVDDGRCSCKTEQGTRYVVEPKICRSIAADGVYNPYRRPARDGQGGQVAQQQEQPAQAPGGDRSGAGVSASAGWPGGVGAQTYTPPGAPGSWHADAFGGSGKGS